MKRKLHEKVMEIAGHLKHVYIATSDREGLPHVSVAGKLEITPEGNFAVSEWFCPGTLSNAQVNPKVSLVIWRPDIDSGYQIVGNIVEVKELAMLNGYAGEGKHLSPIPQVERRLTIRAEKVMAFQHAPHSDMEE